MPETVEKQKMSMSVLKNKKNIIKNRLIRKSAQSEFMQMWGTYERYLVDVLADTAVLTMGDYGYFSQFVKQMAENGGKLPLEVEDAYDDGLMDRQTEIAMEMLTMDADLMPLFQTFASDIWAVMEEEG